MEQDMTRGNPLSVIFMFTLPLAVGNIFQQLYNMADTIIVGRFVGADALAAVGSTGTIMFLLNGFAQGITAGFSVLTAQRFGAGKKEGVKESVTKEENRRLASGWLECFDACDETASAGTYEGVHFHWLMSEVSQGEISSIASSGGEEGSTPNAGPTSSASEEDSYVNSGCKQDAEATYNKFIALKYSYTYQEDTARNGYILHDLHNDDLPIEVITTDSSENGANSFFANEYSNQIQITEDAVQEADSSMSSAEQGMVHSITESEYAELMGEDLDVPALEEEKKEGILSKAISFFTKIFKIEKKWSLKKQRHRSSRADLPRIR